MVDTSVKLFRKDEVSDLLVKIFDGHVVSDDLRNEDQVVADIFAAAVLQAEILGWDIESIKVIVDGQQKIASKYVDKMLSQEQEE